MRYKKLIKLFHTIFIISLTLSCSNNTDSKQVKNWEINYEQGKTLQAVLKKKVWKPVEIPIIIKPSYPRHEDFRYVWLKGVFHINNPSNYQGISTGRIRYADIIFINNYLIGSLPSENVYWNPLPRNYLIPEGVLKEGKNIIYIQLGVYTKVFGGILDDVLIQSEKDFEWTQFLNNLIYKHIPIGMIFIFISCIIPLLIIYIWNRKERLPLYTLFGITIYIIYMLTLQITNKLISYEIYLEIMITIIPLFSVSLIIFIQSIYRVYLSHYNRVVIPILLMIMAIMLCSKNSDYHYQIGFLGTNAALTISIPYWIFIIFRLNSINRDTFLFVMTGMMSMFSGIIMIMEFYSEYLGVGFSDIPTTFCPMLFLLIFAVLFSREIMKRRLETELLYDKLKGFQEHNKELPITDTSEEKLQRVINFIDENYTSGISREGLALAVGISPNYMSSLFNTYTGKSISEYINELRINEAIYQLESGNSKIIDIAFSVGFENSVTFNRAFKKVTGKTPSDYKK